MNEKNNEIIQWIIKADHDLGTAKVTHLHIPDYLDTTTFHCQQAVEKYLKGYLIFLDIEFKRYHDLIYLLELITPKDPEIQKYYDDLLELQSYAVEIRYPNETINLSNEKVEKSISIAKNIRLTITSKMNISVDYNDIIDQ
ncbi:MAG: HEPN domain-containing protein [Bacteroidota bacterium]